MHGRALRVVVVCLLAVMGGALLAAPAGASRSNADESPSSEAAELVAVVKAAQAKEEQQQTTVVLMLLAKAAHDAVWDRIAQCETGGNWAMRGSSYSGGVGFSNRTWDAFGGREFAPNPGLATREQQIVVADRIWAQHGYRAWGCGKTLGL